MQNSLEIQRKVKDRIFATTQLNKMQSALDFLKSMYDKKYNIWGRIFEPLISDSSRWEKLLTTFIDNRNHVAHNKLLDYSSKNTMLKDTREFIKLVMDLYDDSCVDDIKNEIEEFVIKQREDKNIIDYVERKNAEDDWEAEAADIFENN